MKFLLNLLFFLISITSFSQEYFTISGFVREKKSAEELIGANITCKDLFIGVSSNTYGFYSMDLPAGNHSISFSFIGYSEGIFVINLTKDIRLDVELDLLSQQIDEIILEDNSMNKSRSIEMSVNNLDSKSIKKMAVVAGEVDILKSIQLLPGVTSIGEGANGFNVRGGAVDQNLVLLDEMTLYNSSHLFGFVSVFNSDAIKDMKLYKGGIPAKYGSRVSSVLDVRQKEGNSKFYETSGGIGLISSRLMVEGPMWDRSSFMVAGRRSYGDLFLALSKDSAISNNTLYFYDLNLKLNSWIGKKDRIFVSSYLGRDAFKFGNLFASSWGNSTLNLRWLHLFNDKILSNFTYNFNDYDYLISILPQGSEFDWISKIRNQQLSYKISYYHNSKHNFEGGFSLSSYHFEPGIIKPASDTSAIVEFEMRNKYSFETSIFIQDEWEISNRILIQPGIRFSSFYRLGQDTILNYESSPIVYNSYLGQYINGTSTDSLIYSQNEVISSFHNFEPRISLRFQINESNSFKLSFQRISQYLHLITNASSPTPVDIWAPSGPFIKPLIANQYAIGYFASPLSNKFELSVELYYKKLQNVIDYVDAADLDFNNHLETEILYGKGRAYGFEFMLEKKIGKLKGWISYTLARTESLISGSIDEPGINFGNWYPNPQDKTHDFSIVTIFELNKKWNFSSSFVFITGIPTNYPVAKYQFEGISVPEFTGSRNQQRLPNYHRLDFSATFRPKENDTREWVFSIYNLYNRRNASALYFKSDENNLSQNTPVQLSIYPIVPSLTYNFKF